MSYGGWDEAERLRALHSVEPDYASPIELLPSPTWHIEWEPLPDGTRVEWPVLDGPLVVADAWFGEDDECACGW